MCHNVSRNGDEKQKSKYIESSKLLLRIFASQRMVIPFFCGDEKKNEVGFAIAHDGGRFS